MFVSTISFLLLVIVSSKVANAGGPTCSGQGFPNIAYLGKSYDLVRGNPQPWLSNSGGSASTKITDPGWLTLNVIDMQNYTIGNQWDGCAVPNGVDVIDAEACAYQRSFSEVGDAAAYQHSLTGDASVNAQGGLFGFDTKFSSSADYQSVDKGSQSDERIFFSSSSECQFYKASLDAYTTYQLDPKFIRAVATLPVDVSDANNLLLFVQNFGTHYSTEITMGAKASLLFSLDQNDYSSFSSSGFDISAAMDISFGSFGGFNSHINVNKSDTSYRKFSSLDKHTIISCVGAGGQCPLVSNDTAPNDWSLHAKTSPVPLAYQLESIVNVLTSENFPGDPNITQKRDTLATFLEESYCKLVAPSFQKACDPPPKNGYWSRKANVGTGTQNRNQGAGKGLPNGAGVAAGVAVLGDQVYVTGGYADELTEGVESYDPQTNSWTVIPDMPEARYAHVAAVLKGKLYVCGGHDNDLVSTVFIYNPYTTSWSQGPEMPVAIWGAAGGVIDDKLYIAGGYFDDHDSDSSSLYIFDPETEEWTSGKNMSVARNSHGATVLNGKLYVFGRRNSQEPFSGEVYDPTTDSWTDIDLPVVDFDGYFTAAGTLNGKIYLLPSYNDDDDQQFVYVYDPSNGDWFKAPDLKIKRNGLSGTLPTVMDKLYVVGGDGISAAFATEAFWNVSDTSTLSSPQ